jgi:hypothetical protein
LQGVEEVRPTDGHQLAFFGVGGRDGRVMSDYLQRHRDLFGVDEATLNSVRVERDFVTSHNGVRSLTFCQVEDGIDVFGAELRAHLTRAGELVSIGSTLVTAETRNGAWNMSSADALNGAAENLGVSPADVHLMGQAGRVWFPMSRHELRAGWLLQVSLVRDVAGYRMVLDADSGNVLYRENLTSHIGESATFHVFTSDSPSPGSPGTIMPDGFQFPFVAREMLTLSALDEEASPNGWIPAGENETFGNNADVFQVIEGGMGPKEVRAVGSPFRVFDFPIDFGMEPTTYVDAVKTQVFYWVNVFHDRMYSLGFDEAAGNFQLDNFGRGGAGGDPVLAEIQPAFVTNSASFMTLDDGIPGRLTLSPYTGPTPDRDAGLDAEVVLHELTHGMTARLIGSLASPVSRGLSEGWSDFFALALLSEPRDDIDGNYPSGGYITLNWIQNPAGWDDNYYFGIRRFPYSTDLVVNPLTYADLDPFQADWPPLDGTPANPWLTEYSVTEVVHNLGEVWCAALLECRANLVERYGFERGNELMLQLVVDGLKLTPSIPDFLEARDAVILSDVVNNDGANLGEFWTGFAKRGMGFSAESPGAGTTVGVVEAFDVPGMFVIESEDFATAGPAGGPFTPASASYTLRNISMETITVEVSTSVDWLSINGGGLVEMLVLNANDVASVVIGPGADALALPLGQESGEISFVNLTNGLGDTSRGASIEIYQPAVVSFGSSFFDGFESAELGFEWQSRSTGAGRIVLGPGPSPETPCGAGQMVVMDSHTSLADGLNELTLHVDVSMLPVTGGLLLRFDQQEYDDEDHPLPLTFSGSVDGDGVSISGDGLTWHRIVDLTGDSSTAACQSFEVDLSSALAGAGVVSGTDVRIRFQQFDNFSVTSDGMGFDGVSVVAAPNGDGDGDGDVDLLDFGGFQLCFSGDGGGLGAGCEVFDFDEDGDVDLLDFGAFQLGYTG